MAAPLFQFDFSQRIAVDTNVLMNACFVPGGLSRRALDYLRSRTASIYVPDATSREYREIGARLGVSVGTGFDVASVVSAFARQYSLLHAPALAGLILPRINRKDEPIARAAKELGAVLLTDDVDLILECRRASISATQPWEIARSYTGPDALPDLVKIVRYLPLHPAQGYLFARVLTGEWAGRRVDQLFTVADVHDVLKVGYQGLAEQWFVQVGKARPLSLRMPLSPRGHYVVAAQFKVTDGDYTVSLLAASVGQEVLQDRFRSPALQTIPPDATISIGHAKENSGHWNGYLRDLVVSDGHISRRMFKRLASTEDLSPNPLDADRLTEAVARAALIHPG